MESAPNSTESVLMAAYPGMGVYGAKRNARIHAEGMGAVLRATCSVIKDVNLDTRVSRAKINARINVEETEAVQRSLRFVGTGVKLDTRVLNVTEKIQRRRP